LHLISKENHLFYLQIHKSRLSVYLSQSGLNLETAVQDDKVKQDFESAQNLASIYRLQLPFLG